MKKTINADGNKIEIISNNNNKDYISITDIARVKSDEPNVVIQNWMRNKDTIEFLGLWEQLNNKNFKSIEFEGFRNKAGSNVFTLSPQKWIFGTNAIGIISKSGKYGGTYAHKDIAFEFASWVSAKFKLYLIKEFQRLKDEEYKQFGWDIKRNLTKINYHIHTDAIKENLIPQEISKQQANVIYATEADVLNIALFGKTAKQWRQENPSLKGNIRDYADVSQLVCLANLESLNSVLINEKIPQCERLLKLNKIAIEQMQILIKSVEKQLK